MPTRRVISALVGASFCTLTPHLARAAEMLTLHADLREAPRGLIHAAETIAAQPGPLTLAYPKWIPGEHAPSGPVIDLAGLHLASGGKPLSWRRDLESVYLIHVDVPEGASSIEASFDYLVPPNGNGRLSADPITSSQLAILTWNVIVLYPVGTPASEIMVQPGVVLPSGWQFGTSMEVEKSSGSATTFKPVSLEMLVDEPLLAGAHFKHFELGKATSGTPLHVIDCAADGDTALQMPAERLAAFGRMPAEFAAVTGTRNYQTYHFLLALSDHLGDDGIEHHQCSDNRTGERSLVDDDEYLGFASLLTHEYFHSWNGKHRRPCGLLSPDFQNPMHTDLLWVYEGLTEYYGDVLAARVGLWTPEEYREYLALVAGSLENIRGREWRPLQDTADAAPILYYGSKAWRSRRRGTDFYDEGELIWLEADVFIRSRSGGKRSLDDFCRLFLGDGGTGVIAPEKVAGRAPDVAPYDAQDVFDALNKIEPNDWAGFFAERVGKTNAHPPMGGITGAGWSLVYDERPNPFAEANDKASKLNDLRFSLGFSMDADKQEVGDVIPGSPADKAGLGPGMKIIGVNGRKYSDEAMKDALAPDRASKPVLLLVENADYLNTLKLDYDGASRAPHLERAKNGTDLFEEILRPRTWQRNGEVKHK